MVRRWVKSLFIHRFDNCFNFSFSGGHHARTTDSTYFELKRLTGGVKWWDRKDYETKNKTWNEKRTIAAKLWYLFLFVARLFLNRRTRVFRPHHETQFFSVLFHLHCFGRVLVRVDFLRRASWFPSLCVSRFPSGWKNFWFHVTCLRRETRFPSTWAFLVPRHFDTEWHLTLCYDCSPTLVLWWRMAVRNYVFVM